MSLTPYEVLRIPHDCTDDAVRHAYRRLAKTYHPDSNPDNPEAMQRFLEISEAYQLIATPQKRKLWDLMNPPAVATTEVAVRTAAPPIHDPPKRRTTDIRSGGWAAAQGQTAHSQYGNVFRGVNTHQPRLILFVLTGLVFCVFLLVTFGVSGQSHHSNLLTESAINLLANGGPCRDATVTTVDSAASRIDYTYKDAMGQSFTGACHPCTYPPAQTLKVGDTIRIIHLTGLNFSAPLFAFADLTKVDPALVHQVNTLAAQSATPVPAP